MGFEYKFDLSRTCVRHEMNRASNMVNIWKMPIEDSTKDSNFSLLLFLAGVSKIAPTVNTLLSVILYRWPFEILRPMIKKVATYYTPSQFLSSSAFLFLCATSSSFFLASNPSFARFILTALPNNCQCGERCLMEITHFLLLTSSSINKSLDCALNLVLKGGSKPWSFGSEFEIDTGRLKVLRTTLRAWLMTLSSSSRWSLSDSSDSACGKSKDIRKGRNRQRNIWRTFLRISKASGARAWEHLSGWMTRSQNV